MQTEAESAQVFAQSYPRYLLRIVNKHEEFYALLMFFVERHYLRTHGKHDAFSYLNSRDPMTCAYRRVVCGELLWTEEEAGAIVQDGPGQERGRWYLS